MYLTVIGKGTYFRGHELPYVGMCNRSSSADGMDCIDLQKESMVMMEDDMEWQWSGFDGFSTVQLYDLLVERQKAFVVEYRNANLDADGLDKIADHLILWRRLKKNLTLLSYLRVLPPGLKYREPSIGRVFTPRNLRNRGHATLLINEAIKRIAKKYPGDGIRISAQLEQEKFYHQFDFKTVGEPYMEEGMPHIEMLREEL